jgi:hypothetical protein
VLRAAQPTPLAETTRRFLRPLVGVDPASVRVYRDARADALASAYRADGLATGDAVALSAAHSEDTPATLGLLAHELTHVARQRNPSFAPPLARQLTASATPDEEAIATTVETQVQTLARRRAQPEPTAPEPGQAAIPHPGPAPSAAAAPAQPASWGGLPAPWEPLPDWLAPATPVARPATPPASRPAAAAKPAPAPAAAPADASPQPQAGQAPAPVQLAQTGRALAEPPADAEPAPEPAPVPEPDLDALARQVYGMLKQRLAAERRRSQS